MTEYKCKYRVEEHHAGLNGYFLHGTYRTKESAYAKKQRLVEGEAINPDCIYIIEEFKIIKRRVV